MASAKTIGKPGVFGAPADRPRVSWVRMFDPVDEADEAIDGLVAVDLSSLSAEALAAWTIEVHRLQQRLDAVACAATAAFDRHGDPQGAIGAAAWVAWKCRVPKGQAKAEVANGRALRRMPAATLAFQAGAIGRDQVRVLAAAQRSAPEAFAAKECELVEDAMRLRFEAFERRVRCFRLEHDRDGEDRRGAEAIERRGAWASKTFEGSVEITATLDPVGGDIWLRELERIERRLFEADWAEARSRLGDAARAEDLRRTPAQRRADAMDAMAIRSHALLPDGQRKEHPLFSVHVGYETFAGALCQLDDGTVVAPSAIVPWLIDALGTDVDLGAAVERIVFDGPSRVIDVGATQRLFRGATRRAVQARDLFCWHDSCDQPYTRSDVDHIQRYEHDGPTVQANGRVACPHHNPGRRRPYQPPPPDDD